MAIDASTLAVAFSPGLTAAVLGWFTYQMRRNGRNGTKNPFDPDTRLGDVPVPWWSERQKEVVDAMKGMAEETKGMREAVEAHMKEHH